MRVDRLLRNIALRQEILIPRQVCAVVYERLLGLLDRGLIGAHRVHALRDRERALIDRVRGVGVIAIGGCEVRLKLCLQVRSVELGKHLPGVHRVALAHVYLIGRLGKRALNGDVLIRRDDARQVLFGFDRSVAGNARLYVRQSGRLGVLMASASTGGQDCECRTEESQGGVASFHWLA